MADILANEGGSVFVTADFTDRAGDAVVPNSITWSLTDGASTVINSRDEVSISPAASVTVELSGDDLPWVGNTPTEKYYLFILFQPIYDEVDASDVPQNQENRIVVSNLRGVS